MQGGGRFTEYHLYFIISLLQKSAVDVIAQVEEETVPTKKKNKNKKAKVDPEVVEKPSEVEVDVPALKKKSKKSKKVNDLKGGGLGC